MTEAASDSESGEYETEGDSKSHHSSSAGELVLDQDSRDSDGGHLAAATAEQPEQPRPTSMPDGIPNAATSAATGIIPASTQVVHGSGGSQKYYDADKYKWSQICPAYLARMMKRQGWTQKEH